VRINERRYHVIRLADEIERTIARKFALKMKAETQSENPPRKSARGALLFLGDYYGTVAAARCLGERGVDVALAESSRFSRAGASRYVRSVHRCPEVSDAAAFMQWLLHKGQELQGRVLYPASDELVFLFASRQEELRKYYTVYLPPFADLYRILNKQRIHEACARTGVRSPTTWFPRGEDELRTLLSSGEIKEEVILKPKTQIQLASGAKAAEIKKGSDVIENFRAFMRNNPYGKELVEHDPDVVWPMVQAYHRQAAQSIYSLAGFTDGSDRLPLIRASRKILQRPRKLGIGLCFESAEVLPSLVEKIGALTKDLNYRGIFEIEFIEHEGEFLLIDFNPRGYSQMAFEMKRALPLPYLQWLAATHDDVRLDQEWTLASNWKHDSSYAYCHSLLLGLLDGGQRVTEALFSEKSEHWSEWRKEHAANLTDAVRAPGDPGPVVLDVAKQMRDFVKHPRAFWRSLSR
jgi:D-aspartate ligase